MILKRGGSKEPQLTVLPWCAECGKEKDHLVHITSLAWFEPHEFEPCVSLKEYEALERRFKDEEEGGLK